MVNKTADIQPPRLTVTARLSKRSVDILKKYDDDLDNAISEMYNLLNPGENLFGVRVENLYNSLVAPYTKFGPSRNSDAVTMVRMNFGRKPEFRNSVFWERAFRKMRVLRGLLDSQACTVEGLVRTRGQRPPVVIWVAAGRYDTWLAPKPSGCNLEQVIFQGSDPGDWINPPMPADPDVLTKHFQEAKARYQALVPQYVVRWIAEIGPTHHYKSNHFGLLDGIVEARRDRPEGVGG